MSAPLDQQTPVAQPRRRQLPWWAVGLVAVLIAAGGFVVFRYVIDDSSTDGSAGASQCAAVRGVVAETTLALVDCGDDRANFKIATRKPATAPGCPEGAYREVTKDSELLCLAPNFVAGQCYLPDDPNQAFVRGDCKSPEAILILKVVDGTADAKQACDDGNGLGYPEPPTSICIDTTPEQ